MLRHQLNCFRRRENEFNRMSYIIKFYIENDWRETEVNENFYFYCRGIVWKRRGEIKMAGRRRRGEGKKQQNDGCVRFFFFLGNLTFRNVFWIIKTKKKAEVTLVPNMQVPFPSPSPSEECCIYQRGRCFGYPYLRRITRNQTWKSFF